MADQAGADPGLDPTPVLVLAGCLILAGVIVAGERWWERATTARSLR